jgi:hypothetical protein
LSEIPRAISEVHRPTRPLKGLLASESRFPLFVIAYAIITCAQGQELTHTAQPGGGRFDLFKDRQLEVSSLLWREIRMIGNGRTGASPIIAADFSPARRKLAETMGADIIVDPARYSPYRRWSEMATPEGYSAASVAAVLGLGPQPRPAVLFECVGVPGIIQQMLEGAPKHARILIVGVCMERDQFEPFFAIRKELNLQFVLGYTAEEFATTLRNIAEGRIDVAPMITGHVGLAGVKGAFATLAMPEKHAKILVEPWR